MPERQYARWQPHEDDAMRQYFSYDHIDMIAAFLGRTASAISARARNLEIVTADEHFNYIDSQSTNNSNFGNW